VRPAHDDTKRNEPPDEEWLLIEWPEGETEPDHYWLSILPADISFERMVDVTKMRWRIERDYLELKQEVGLGHYEVRVWCWPSDQDDVGDCHGINSSIRLIGWPSAILRVRRSASRSQQCCCRSRAARR